jgi:serine/threonine-protein kinase
MASAQPPIIEKSMAEASEILCPICHKPNPRRARFCKYCGNDVVLNNDGPRYYITRIIKQGGQGAVYETVGDDGKIYAVKEMLDRFDDPKERAEALERFASEAELLRQLTHPQIPRVYATFKDEGRQYLAMDFVRGRDMEQFLETRASLPEAEVLAIAAQLCNVLSYLHKRGFIYRDMKPSNIMLEADGTVKLVDFGIAKVFQPTQRGTQIGTPGYAPPEQYQGLATHESDIYALGASLHHMLSGRDPRDEKPFSFPPLRTLKPEISLRTANAIGKALQMKPDDRYHSVEAFWSDLRPSAPPRAAPPPRTIPATSSVPAAARPANPLPTSVAVPGTTIPRTTPNVLPPLAPPNQRGGFGRAVRRFVSFVLVLIALIAALAFGLLQFAPSALSPYAETINQYVPNAVPTATVAMRVQPFTTDVEVVVPEGVEMINALREAFEQAARAQLGPETQILTNQPPATIGQPELLGTEAGGARYRARMQGLVSAPIR